MINPTDALFAYFEEFDDPKKSLKISVKNNHSLPLEIVKIETQEGEEVLNLRKILNSSQIDLFPV